jgi:hypothetical protein
VIAKLYLGGIAEAVDHSKVRPKPSQLSPVASRGDLMKYNFAITPDWNDYDTFVDMKEHGRHFLDNHNYKVVVMVV